jgi:hypothetical protein
MSAKMRPEISVKSPYWIERHRYYELKHFCLQYPYWKKMYGYLDGYARRQIHGGTMQTAAAESRPTEKIGEKMIFYADRMAMIKRTAEKTSPELGCYIFKAVTEDYSYDQLRARETVPCGRDMYYAAYRRFFWLLSRERE